MQDFRHYNSLKYLPKFWQGNIFCSYGILQKTSALKIRGQFKLFHKADKNPSDWSQYCNLPTGVPLLTGKLPRVSTVNPNLHPFTNCAVVILEAVDTLRLNHLLPNFRNSISPLIFLGVEARIGIVWGRSIRWQRKKSVEVADLHLKTP